ncbi:MAG: glycosyltransferase family 4 protein [Bacteroidales bacterium]|nr:glycosyltransferase family 4 protein [Bacteroidales bacterium]
MKKTICFFNSNKSWGGGEQWHYDMAVRLANRGSRVVMFTNFNSELYHTIKNQAGIEVYQLKMSNRSFLNPVKVKRLIRLFSHIQIQSIILNLPADVKLAGVAAKKAGIENIIYRRGSALPVRNTLLNKYYFRKVISKVLTNSRATKNTILEKNSALIPEEKIHVLYNGLDLEEFDRRPVADHVEEPAKILIGNLGRMVYQKGQEMLLDVAGKLAADNISFKMIIGGDGPYRKRIQHLIEKKGLEKHMELRGVIDDAKSFLNDIHIFVLSSRWEGFGYVIAEAMACEKPVVAFDISSNPELIEHGKTGFLVKPFDTAGMASHIIDLARDEALRKKMGKQGRKRIEKYFTMERVINNLEEII